MGQPVRYLPGPAGPAGPAWNTVTGTGTGGSLNPVAGRWCTGGEAPAGPVPGRADSPERVPGPGGRQRAREAGRAATGAREGEREQPFAAGETVTIMVRLPYCLDHVFDGRGAPGHDRQSH